MLLCLKQCLPLTSCFFDSPLAIFHILIGTLSQIYLHCYIPVPKQYHRFSSYFPKATGPLNSFYIFLRYAYGVSPYIWENIKWKTDRFKCTSFANCSRETFSSRWEMRYSRITFVACICFLSKYFESHPLTRVSCSMWYSSSRALILK